MGIAVLGPLVVEGVGRIGPRDRVVLAALSVRPGEVLSADQLADALWGEAPPPSGPKVVQGCVMRLRKALGAHAVETTAQGYRLAVPPDDVDARRFERLVGRARELLTLGEPERASYVVGEALSLWRGQPLVEVDGWDAGHVEAVRLEQLRLDAEELKLDAALRAGHFRDVLGEARSRVAQSPLRERRWALLAIAQYQAGRQAEALGTLHQVRGVLARELGLDPGPDLVALEQAILRQDPSLVAEVALPDPAGSCPYFGLVPYDVEDDEVFFGRDSDMAACRQRLDSAGVLVVVGPSGCGKSSLVRAGLAAVLRREGRRVVVITPGAHPMDALTALSESGPPPVLVVGQCEGAVSLCEDDTERARFFQALAEYAERGALAVSLRADRLGEVSAHPEFARLVERGLYLLGAMGEDDLRAAIEGPAHQAGILVEPGLVELLIRDVEGEPGALPLLSHALRETWQRREGRTLTVEGYRRTGKIRGAVAQSAEELYDRVAPDQRPLLRNLLLRLVMPTTDGDPVRSRVPRSLVAADKPHEHLVELLVGARLVTSDDGVVELAHEALARAWPRLRGWLAEDSEGQRMLRHLSVAAEAWDGLGRPDSELYRGVRLAQALDWRDRARPDLTGTEQAFLDRSGAQVDAELLEAQRRADREAAARRRTRRFAAGLMAALVLTMIATGLAIGYQRSAATRAAQAEASRELAEANRLAALSTSVGSLDLSLLLAAEAAQIASTPETQDGLLTALVEHRRAQRVVSFGGQPHAMTLGDDGRLLFVNLGQKVVAWRVGSDAAPREVTDSYFFPSSIDAAPTRDLVAILGEEEDGQEVALHTEDGERRLLLDADTIGGGWALEVAFTADGSGLLLLVANQTPAGAWEGSVREVELTSGSVRTTHRGVLRSSGPEVFVDANFAADGSAVAVWSAEPNGAAVRVDLADGSRTRLRVDPRPADSRQFVPLPTGAAQLWADGAVTRYDRRGRPVQVLDAQGPVTSILTPPDGATWAATTGADGAVLLWDVDEATGLWSRRESLAGHDGAVTGAELAPDGRTILTASTDHTVIAWDVTADAGFGSALRGLRDRWIANRPELIRPGLLVAPTRPVSRSGDGSHVPSADTVSVAATFLDADSGRGVDHVPVGRTMEGALSGSSVAVSPDRQLVAVTSGFATTVLDTRTREVVGRVALPPVEDGDPGDESSPRSCGQPVGTAAARGCSSAPKARSSTGATAASSSSTRRRGDRCGGCRSAAPCK